jgi:hypothetical protein
MTAENSVERSHAISSGAWFNAVTVTRTNRSGLMPPGSAFAISALNWSPRICATISCCGVRVATCRSCRTSRWRRSIDSPSRRNATANRAAPGA